MVEKSEWLIIILIFPSSSFAPSTFASISFNYTRTISEDPDGICTFWSWALANTQLSHIRISKEETSHRKTKFIIFTHPRPHYTAQQPQHFNSEIHPNAEDIIFPEIQKMLKMGFIPGKMKKLRWETKRSQKIFHPIWIYRKIHSAKR